MFWPFMSLLFLAFMAIWLGTGLFIAVPFFLCTLGVPEADEWLALPSVVFTWPVFWYIYVDEKREEAETKRKVLA